MKVNPKYMIEISDEQKIIVDFLIEGYNVIVDACAGSGKSTTILWAAKLMPEREFIIITYNSMLRHEMVMKIKELHIENIEVHTYNSLEKSKYLPNEYSDTGIRKILRDHIDPLSPLSKKDIIVIDEVQDMTKLYYQFVYKYACDMGSPYQLMILGDYMQGIYEFKGADSQFLTKADLIWYNHPFLKTPDFKKCVLKTSYRITNQMGDFENKIMLGNDRMITCRDGSQVYYYSLPDHSIQKTMVFQIKTLLGEGVLPGSIFILVPSLKCDIIYYIENLLVEQGIPCYIPMYDMDNLNEKVVSGKIVFSTFHSSKGRQRQHVFILGFDNSYMNIYAKDKPLNECPNTLYVATTRATHGLYLFQSNKPSYRPLPFLHMNQKEIAKQPYISFKGIPQITYMKNNNPQTRNNRHNINTTDLIKFIKEDVLDDISSVIDRIFICENTDIADIEVPSIINTKKGLFEDVSDINGIVIPAIFSDFIQTRFLGIDACSVKNVLYDIIQDKIDALNPDRYSYLHRKIADLVPYCKSISDYLYMANLYKAVDEKLLYKLYQIADDEYNWIPQITIDLINQRIFKVIECDSMPEIEKTIIGNYDYDENKHAIINQRLAQYFETAEIFRFSARLDMITETTIWEFKFTSTLSQDNLLQVIIYAWLWNILYKEKPKQFKVFNIRTNQVMTLCGSFEDLEYIVVALLKNKYVDKIITKEDFVEECLKITQGYL